METNPLRDIASGGFQVQTGSSSLVANGVYSVEDIVTPAISYEGLKGDPRLYVTEGHRRTNLKWRKVNKGGWISPKEKAQGDKDTVIQIRFSRPKKLNYIVLDLLKVPQTWEIRYYDHNRKRMVTFSDTRGEKLKGDIEGVRVNVVDPRGDQSTSKKWQNYQFKLPKVRTNHIEIRLNRDTTTTDHGDFFGLPRSTPYALGVRNLRIKYRLRTDDDDDGDSNPTPIGTTERLLISRYTSALAHDDDAQTYWECAPQGAANSVVPYYLDIRDPDGEPSLVDTLKTTPLWTGPRMTVYYSNDDVTTPWVISGNRQNFEVEGDNASFAEGTGLSVDGTASVWVMDNSNVRMDLAKSFVLGFLFTPTDTNSSSDRFLVNFVKDTDYVGLLFDATADNPNNMTGKFKVQQNGVTLFQSASYQLDKNTEYGVVLGYVQDDSEVPRGWYLSFAEQPALTSDITNDTGTTNNPLAATWFPEEIHFGNDLTQNKPMLGGMTKLWLRLDTYRDWVSNTFLINPEPFIFGDGEQSQRTNGYYNGILLAKLDDDAAAKVGPGPGYFSNKEWTPVPVDYTLSTSHYPLPLMRAKFMKLEFTNLVPRIYLTEDPELPVRDFPQQVRDWFRTTTQNQSGTPYGINVGRNFFEAVPAIGTPGDPRRFPSVSAVLNGRSGTGLPVTLYHGDMSSAEYAINPDNFDGSLRYQELEYAVTPLRFYRTGRHDYEVHFVESQHRAFFVGLKEVQVFRNDFTVQYDTPEYAQTFETSDDQYIETNTGVGNKWVNVGGAIMASDEGDQLLTKTFESFSNFETIQMAVLDQGWESEMTSDEIDLVTLSHLEDNDQNNFNNQNSTSTTHFDVVTGQYQGARGGNVIEVSQVAGLYGIATDHALFNSPAITGSNPRTSAAIRIQFPDTRNGKYELRIWAKDGSNQYRIVAKKPIVVPPRKWAEVEVAYIAVTDDSDWYAEVTRTDVGTNEHFVVDMFGLWQNAVKWEVANGADAVQTLTLTSFGLNRSFTLAFDGSGASTPISLQNVISGQSYTQELGVEDGAVPSQFEPTNPDPITTYRNGGSSDGPFDNTGAAVSDTGSPGAFNDDFGTQTYITPRSQYPIGFPDDVSTQTHYSFTPSYVFAGTVYASLSDAIQAALVSLSTIASGDVTVYGSGTGPFTIVFNSDGAYAGVDVPLITFAGSGATGTVSEAVAGGGWTELLWPLNKSTGYVRFANADFRLKVRITALRAGAVVGGWTIVPWYIESPMVVRAPIDYNPPWGISDSEDLLDASHKPIFRLWNHWFPQRYSTNLLGIV